MRRYRRVGAERLPRTTRRLRRMGVFPIRDHYYEPLFDPAHLSRPLDEPRDLPGVDLNAAGQLALLERLTHADEFEAWVNEQAQRADAAAFSIANSTYGAGDADVLFQMIRHLKPARLLEIGSGSSTKVARAALALNEAEGRRAQHVCVEPFEQPWLDAFEGIELVRERIERCGVALASELEAGDLVFVDSSHMIRPQGDVLYEYLELLPRLPPGVVVHVHDIFTPRDYPAAWVTGSVRFWNEQYLLEATLGASHRYEVVAALNMLRHDHFDALAAVCPFLRPEHEPGAFYFRVRA